jgi:hypothetical protein
MKNKILAILCMLFFIIAIFPAAISATEKVNDEEEPVIRAEEAEVTGLSTTATEIEQGDSVSYTVTTDLDTVSLRMYITLIGQKLSSYSVLTETSD